MKPVDNDIRDGSIFRMICARCEAQLDVDYQVVAEVWENQWQVVFSQCGCCGKINSYPIRAMYEFLTQIGDDVMMPERTMDVRNNDLMIGVEGGI